MQSDKIYAAKTLETGHDASPVSQQCSVRHEVESNISMREQIDDVTDKRPIRVLLQHRFGTVHHVAIALTTCCTFTPYRDSQRIWYLTNNYLHNHYNNVFINVM